jgi:hypothetical protein
MIIRQSLRLKDLSPLFRIARVTACIFVTQPAVAVIFYETANPSHNTIAPTATYADSGWQYQGLLGGFLGTMISPQLFITAQHIGTPSTTFTSTLAFNGTGDVTYHVDTTANGGAGYWDIAGADLRIYKINESFSSYASLFSGSDEVGKSLVTIGRGGLRGDPVFSGEAKGWKTGGSDGTTRWGTNEVSAIVGSGSGAWLAAEFDAITGAHEAFWSSGDSGGAVFIQEGGTWKLAGINSAIEGSFDTNNIIGDGSDFTGALFDVGGLYVGSDAGGWTLIPDQTADRPQRLYAARISSNLAAIDAVIQSVPEPSGAFLIIGALPWILRRRREGRPSLEKKA